MKTYTPEQIDTILRQREHREGTRRSGTLGDRARDNHRLLRVLDYNPLLQNDNSSSIGPSTQAAINTQQENARSDDDDYQGTNPQVRDRRGYNINVLLAEQYVQSRPHLTYRSGESSEFRSTSSHGLSTLDRACLTPLPLPTPEEDASFQSHPTRMMEEELEEGRFHEAPLAVEHGIAVLEESVDWGVPDVITQT
ncbi:hypothetical protein SLS62_004541 [Diatrype stigma]|uniref:Uncharacterized protein n=1 Tax=Diatrype stigma TaxID=117547 RepID=A0AAN9UU50_9PEZI